MFWCFENRGSCWCVRIKGLSEPPAWAPKQLSMQLLRCRVFWMEVISLCWVIRSAMSISFVQVLDTQEVTSRFRQRGLVGEDWRCFIQAGFC